MTEIGSLIERTPLADRWTIAPALLGELHTAVDALGAEIETYVKRNVVDALH